MTGYIRAEAEPPVEIDRPNTARMERMRLVKERVKELAAKRRALAASIDSHAEEDKDHDSRAADFFNGKPMYLENVNFDTGGIPEISDNKVAEIESALTDLIDNLDNDTPVKSITSKFYMGDSEADETLIEKSYPAPAFVSRYEKAFTRLRSLEGANADQVPQDAGAMKEAVAAFEAEKRLALDPHRRATDRIDLWRATDGRERYNASRRKREMPNDHTPKAVLNAMSAGERAQHKTDMNAKRVWKSEKRKAGWNDQQIEDGLSGWWEKRETRRASGKRTGNSPYADNPAYGAF